MERCKPTNKRREIRYKGKGGLVKKNLDIYIYICVDVFMMWLKGGGCFFLYFFLNWKVLQKCHPKILVELLYIVS